jgi:hypothetical protein
MMRRGCAIGFAAIWMAGCAGQFAQRDESKYREDSRALLMTKAPTIKACYDGALKADPKVAGMVVVHFKVQPETGLVVEPRLDDQKTTAPATLGSCVLRAVEGLKLDPADSNEGLATFAWEFKARG